MTTEIFLEKTNNTWRFGKPMITHIKIIEKKVKKTRR